MKDVERTVLLLLLLLHQANAATGRLMKHESRVQFTHKNDFVLWQLGGYVGSASHHSTSLSTATSEIW